MEPGAGEWEGGKGGGGGGGGGGEQQPSRQAWTEGNATGGTHIFHSNHFKAEQEGYTSNTCRVIDMITIITNQRLK